MGKANIISHIADGQYTAEILYDETQMQAQIDAITQALTLVGEQITEAAASIVTLESQLAQQKETLRLRVLAWRTLLEEQAVLKGDIERLEEELEELEEELASLQEILQFLQDAGADQADIDLQQSRIDNKQDQIDAKTDELQQANTDLATNESEAATVRTEIDGLYDTASQTKSNLDMAKNKHGHLILRQATLDARLLSLDANKPPEDIRDIWCADLTEDLTGEWPTLDIPGESELILLAPEEYVDEHNLHATTTSQFAPVIAMSPAQAAFNFAIHPGWQRHKPTYRVGVITAIDTTEDTASVTLDAANSRYQNLNVNEATFLADIDVVYMSCNASAFEVDDRVVVEFPYQIPSEQHLQQTISNLAAAHSTALAFKTDLEARLAEVEADKTAAEAVRDSLSAQLSAQMSADPVDMTAIEITLAQQVVNGALVTRLTQKKIFTDQAISATSNRIQRIQTAFDDATALAAVYPGPRVIGFETEPQACEFSYIVLTSGGFYTLLKVKGEELEIAEDEDGNKIENKEGNYLDEFPAEDFEIDDEEFDYFIERWLCGRYWPGPAGCNFDASETSCLQTGENNTQYCVYDHFTTYDSETPCNVGDFPYSMWYPDWVAQDKTIPRSEWNDNAWKYQHLIDNKVDRPNNGYIVESNLGWNLWSGSNIEIIYNESEQFVVFQKDNDVYYEEHENEHSRSCAVHLGDGEYTRSAYIGNNNGSILNTDTRNCELTGASSLSTFTRASASDWNYCWLGRSSQFSGFHIHEGDYAWSYSDSATVGEAMSSSIPSVRGNKFGAVIAYSVATDVSTSRTLVAEYGDGGSPVPPAPRIPATNETRLAGIKAYYKHKPPENENDPAIKDEPFPYPENIVLAQSATDLYETAKASIQLWAFKAKPKPEEEPAP